MIPQYSTSTDVEVLAAIARNEQARQAFRTQAFAFVRKYATLREDDEPIYWGSGTRISSIYSRAKPTEGQWTRGYGGKGWRPFKNDPIYAEMETIYARQEPVPGLPRDVRSQDTPDGRMWIMWPQPFVWDGVAWLGFQAPPAVDQRSRDAANELGSQWSECLASEYARAAESWRAS